jgi:hypothetical protein
MDTICDAALAGALRLAAGTEGCRGRCLCHHQCQWPLNSHGSESESATGRPSPPGPPDTRGRAAFAGPARGHSRIITALSAFKLVAGAPGGAPAPATGTEARALLAACQRRRAAAAPVAPKSWLSGDGRPSFCCALTWGPTGPTKMNLKSVGDERKLSAWQ